MKYTNGYTIKLLILSTFLVIYCNKNSGNKLKSPLFGTMIDIEGNVYTTVRIGSQEWMAENLRVTKFNDGTDIPHLQTSTKWQEQTTPTYCYYKNTTNADAIKKWGALYNWYTVAPTNQKQIAPEGWKVPSNADWDFLIKYLVVNGYNYDNTRDISTYNKIAKSMAAKKDWQTCKKRGVIGANLIKNNYSGFSALPVGFLSPFNGFIFHNQHALWWSSTERKSSNKSTMSWAYHQHLGYHRTSLLRNYSQKNSGYSLRLVRDIM